MMAKYRIFIQSFEKGKNKIKPIKKERVVDTKPPNIATFLTDFTLFRFSSKPTMKSRNATPNSDNDSTKVLSMLRYLDITSLKIMPESKYAMSVGCFIFLNRYARVEDKIMMIPILKNTLVPSKLIHGLAGNLFFKVFL